MPRLRQLTKPSKFFKFHHEGNSETCTTSGSRKRIVQIPPTKVIVHMHGRFKTNTVTKLMRKHIRGEKITTVTKSNKCRGITGSKFKRSLGNNCASQPNQTKIVAGILNQFNDRSIFKHSVQIIDENSNIRATIQIIDKNSNVCSGITVQVNNFAGILDQFIDQNSNDHSGITVQVTNFAGILIQFIDQIQTITQE